MASHSPLYISHVTAVLEKEATDLELYIVFKTGDSKSQTSVTKTGEWSDTFTVEKFSPRSTTILEAEVYDKRTLLPDSNLGTGYVDLAKLSPQSLNGKGDRVNLQLSNKKSQSTGTLSFLLNAGGYTGTGATSGTTTGTGVTGAHHTTGAGTGVGTTTSSAGTARGVGATGVGTGGTARSVGATGVGTGVATGAHGATRTRSISSSSSSDEDGTKVSRAGRRGVGTGVATGVTTDASRNLTPGTEVDRKYYTGHEDRSREQALIEKVRDHQPFVQDYETTVHHTGRERQVGSELEALGTEERVVGGQRTTAGVAGDLVQAPAGATHQRPGGEGWVQGKPGPKCDVQSFEIPGENVVDRERVTQLREHRDFEKEFEVATHFKGERAGNVAPELVDRERVLVDEKAKNACAGSSAPGQPGPASGATSGANPAQARERATYGAGGSQGVNPGTTGVAQGVTQGVNPGTAGGATHGVTPGNTTTGSGYGGARNV